MIEIVCLILFSLLLQVCNGINLPCGFALTANDPLFANFTRVDNQRVQRSPALVVVAMCEQDVAVALQYASNAALPFSVLGGGHSALGFGVVDGGVVISMRAMNATFIDVQKNVLHTETGVTFGELYAKLQQIDPRLLLVGGGCPSVGVAGFMAGGGLSFLSRPFGLGTSVVLI